MSVLSFPRVYFKGYMEWDPCTFNNNDWTEFPTYDVTSSMVVAGMVGFSLDVDCDENPT